MHLTLSPHNPINAIYTDSVSGVEQYKVQTELKVHDSVTTISRRIDSDIPRRGEGQAGPESKRFGLLAKILWRVVGSSVIQFGDREIDTATFFRHKGFGLFGWEPGFTAEDGNEYRWRMKINCTTLELVDKSATRVAEYHGKSRGVIGKAHEPSLEIFPQYEYMADEIMACIFFSSVGPSASVSHSQQVAFIYVEKTRKS